MSVLLRLRHTLTSLAIVTIFAAAAPERADPALHFALARSAPAAGASVETPAEVRLWFTQEPQHETTSIRVVEAQDAGVRVGDVTQDPDDPTSFAVSLHGALPAGSYTVSWRGMGADGHVVRDTFEFTVVGSP